MHPSLHLACDRSIAHASATAAQQPPMHAGWVLAATILASSLAFVDGSVVNVGLPAIGQGLGESGAALSWVLNAYLLPLSALLLLGGALGDAFGRRRLLVAGIAVFAAASLACALAPGLPSLLAGRVLQGVGAAMLLPNSLAILGATFEGESRGRAIGIWAGVGAAAGALGPLLGGWLIDTLGWRSIFFVNLPIAAAAAVLTLRHVPGDAPRQPASLDVAGGAVATLALGALTWGLTAWSAQQHASSAIMIAIAAGGLGLVAFVLVERSRGDRAMLPLALFGSSDFIGLSLLTLLLYGALGGLLVLVPYTLIESRGYTATQAGAALIPLPLVIAAASSTMGRLAGRMGARLPLAIGPMVAAAGCILALRVSAPGSYWTQVFPALIVISIGMAIAVAPLTNAVLSSVEPEHTGVASGFNSAIARTGGLLATALLGGIFATHGSALAAPYRMAALAAACAAVLAGVCAIVFVGRPKRPGQR